jgi:hypothetical protein
VKRTLMSVLVLVALSFVVGASVAVPASANGLNRVTNASYFCAKHPNSPSCIAVKPATVPKTGGGGTFANAGTIASVSGLPAVSGSARSASPTQLPASGGAAGGAVPPQSPDRMPLYLLFALAAVVLGTATRTVARRRV